MDWAVETEAERTMLKRIVMLLYCLADLAEQASGRSLAIRHLVFVFLRLAESVARKMVVRDAQRFGAPMPELLVAGHVGDSADDAMRLARRFRELALALESLVALILVAGVRIAGRQAQAGPSRVPRQTMGSIWPLLDSLPKQLDRKPVMLFDTS